MTSTDLQNDLLADLQSASYAAPAPIAARTPTLDLRLTPLRWSGLRVSAAAPPSGLAVHLGPVRVRLSLGR